MIKVIFICSGNICRSAMAKGYMEERLRQLNLVNKIEISSAGTTAKTGEESTEFANEAIKSYGVEIKGHKATHIKDSNVLDSDYIIVMTKAHKSQILELYKNRPEIKNKIYILKEFSEEKKYLDIDDPWGFNINVYRKCAGEIVKSIDNLIEKLQKEV